MIVAVLAVLMMQMPGHQVIGVPGVRNRLVPAARAMHVRTLVAAAGVRGRAAVGIALRVRELVAIRMAVVHVVHVAFVEVVGVPVVLYGGVATVGAVLMGMLSGMSLASHTRMVGRGGSGCR